MKNKGMKYEFTAKVWNYSSTVGTGGWHIACLPKEMSKEIRENLGKRKSEKRKRSQLIKK